MSDSAKAERLAKLKYEKKLRAILLKRGYGKSTKIVDTLQGTIWRAIQQQSNKPVVIKITSKELTSESSVVISGKKHKIHESILQERNVLRHLSKDENCPRSIVRYVDFMKSNVNFYLIEEDGGHSLFDFNVKVHEYIQCGKIAIGEWHKVVKIVFGQLVECLHYMHSKYVAHFDVSLENALINDVDVTYTDDEEKLVFCYETDVDAKQDVIQAKLCDFGLAEQFDEEGTNKAFQSKKFCGKQCYQSPEITKQTEFDARKNDIWCLGVCLFMLITGNAPFRSSSENDPYFKLTMADNGNITTLMKKWNKMEYLNDDLVQLLQSIFQYEEKRATLKDIKESKWLTN